MSYLDVANGVLSWYTDVLFQRAWEVDEIWYADEI